MRHDYRTLATRAVEQDPGSDDGVLEPTAADRVLRAFSPHQRIAFVEIEEHGGPGSTRDTTCRHVQKATGESHLLSCGQSIHDAAILRLSNVPLRREMTTPATGGKYYVRSALEGRGNGVLLCDVAGDEVERRPEPGLRAYRVPGEDTDRHTLTLKALSNEKTRASSATYHKDKLVDTHEVVSGLTDRA